MQKLYSNTPQSNSILRGSAVTGDFVEPENFVAHFEYGIIGYERIRRLMTVMEQNVPNKAGWPDEATFRLRVRLDLEEFFEKLVLGYYNGNAVEIIDGACDVEVVGTGSVIAFGVNHEMCMAEVDRSNLSKLDKDGKPIKDEYGKFLKGPNYSKPNLLPFLDELATTEAPYDTKAIVAQEFSEVLFGQKNMARNRDLLDRLGVLT